MIKYNWEINDNERKRILSLHENATKKHYLIKEQDVNNQDNTEEDIIPNNVPKNVSFRFRFKNEKYSFPNINGVDCETTSDGRVRMYWNEDWHYIPDVREINQPKFWINDDGLPQGVEEWDWINSLNDELPARYKPQMPFAVVPAYGKSDLSLHILLYYFVQTKGKKMTEADDFLQSDDQKFISASDGSRWKIKGADLPTEGRIPQQGEVPPKPKPPEEKIYKFDLSEPFKFDDVALTPDAETKFNELIEYIKNNYQGVQGNVEVLASSSIDQDPNQVIVGKFPACSSNDKNHTRHDYNLCLSQKRAENIIKLIKEKSGNSSLQFVPKGIGETEQFDPGQKWPQVTDNTKTAKNRRLIINLPQITKKVEKQ